MCVAGCVAIAAPVSGHTAGCEDVLEENENIDEEVEDEVEIDYFEVTSLRKSLLLPHN